MPLLLLIDCATENCSVTLSDDTEILSHKEELLGKSHASVITLFIQEVIKNGNKTLSELDAVAISAGPGSYTGLRIGVATAKGICFALQKSLIAVSTLHSMAHGLKMMLKEGHFKSAGLPDDVWFCPMIDARRMEVYTSLYNTAVEQEIDSAPVILTEDSYFEALEKKHIVFFGTGANKFRSFIGDHPNAYFLNDFHSSSKFMLPLAILKYGSNKFEDLAYYEPNYLKEFYVEGKG